MSEDRSEGWEMPKPVFRSSTGELVTPAELREDPEPNTLEPVESNDPLAQLYDPPAGHVPEAAAADPPNEATDVEPQPYLSEDFPADAVDAPIAAGQPKGSGSLWLIVGALILLGIAAGFVYLVYYLFFAGRAASNGF